MSTFDGLNPVDSVLDRRSPSGENEASIKEGFTELSRQLTQLDEYDEEKFLNALTSGILVCEQELQSSPGAGNLIPESRGILRLQELSEALREITRKVMKIEKIKNDLEAMASTLKSPFLQELQEHVNSRIQTLKRTYETFIKKIHTVGWIYGHKEPGDAFVDRDGNLSIVKRVERDSLIVDTKTWNAGTKILSSPQEQVIPYRVLRNNKKDDQDKEQEGRIIDVIRNNQK